MSAPKPMPVPPDSGAGDPGAYELVAEAVAPAAPGAAPTCMGCGALMRPGGVRCWRCGLDSRSRATALPAARGRRPVKRCAGCGYDLSGLNRPFCPECGVPFRPNDQRGIDREQSREVARSEWIKPLVMLGVGWGAVLAHALATGGWAGGWEYLVEYAVALPAGFVAYLVCCVAGVGFDAPLPLMAWRLVGAFALIDAAAVAGGYLPSVYLMWVAPALVAVVVFEQVFDLDWPEALAAGFFTFAARKAAVLAFTGQLAALL